MPFCSTRRALGPSSVTIFRAFDKGVTGSTCKFLYEKYGLKQGIMATYLITDHYDRTGKGLVEWTCEPFNCTHGKAVTKYLALWVTRQ